MNDKLNEAKLNIYVGLVHHPINNKNGELVTTSVTNLDIHDIARSSRTFGVKNYFIVTPLKIQHDLVNKILGHWQGNRSLAYNPDRSDALSSTMLVHSIEEASSKIYENEGVMPFLCVTGANFKEYSGDVADLKKKIDKRPLFLVFGTGWGLHATVVDKADFKLGPLMGAAIDGYNHLSVRSAVAIYLDRICCRD